MEAEVKQVGISLPSAGRDMDMESVKETISSLMKFTWLDGEGSEEFSRLTEAQRFTLALVFPP